MIRLHTVTDGDFNVEVTFSTRRKVDDTLFHFTDLSAMEKIVLDFCHLFLLDCTRVADTGNVKMTFSTC